ncbi:MAG: hypothetical protein KC613_08325 [Myxococcales bacterium]|nr:hypothetical protein [Myxococcales bacterium]MCB9524353.1 hypothetical protein [Myxococcales bacterium]
MKALAIFGGAAVLTAGLVGGSTAIIIGNLGLVGAAAALFIGTLTLEKAPR